MCNTNTSWLTRDAETSVTRIGYQCSGILKRTFLVKIYYDGAGQNQTRRGKTDVIIQPQYRSSHLNELTTFALQTCRQLSENPYLVCHLGTQCWWAASFFQNLCPHTNVNVASFNTGHLITNSQTAETISLVGNRSTHALSLLPMTGVASESIQPIDIIPDSTRKGKVNLSLLSIPDSYNAKIGHNRQLTIVNMGKIIPVSAYKDHFLGVNLSLPLPNFETLWVMFNINRAKNSMIMSRSFVTLATRHSSTLFYEYHKIFSVPP